MDHAATLWASQGGRCAVTGAKMDHTYTAEKMRVAKDLNASLDRIDPDKGYVPGNTRLVCWFVNAMKGPRSDAVFAERIQLLAQALR